MTDASGLQARGQAFWVATVDRFELTDAELEILLEVCRTLDDLDRLAGAVARDGAMVVGSASQPVVNPALTEARGQRLALHRLVAALALPDAGGAVVPTSQTLRAQQASAARWQGHRSAAQRRPGSA